MNDWNFLPSSEPSSSLLQSLLITDYPLTPVGDFELSCYNRGGVYRFLVCAFVFWAETTRASNRTGQK
jgi:hypothetical protein